MNFFASFKRIWSKLIQEWRSSNRNIASLPKVTFSQLLKVAMERIQEKAPKMMQDAFRKCGIVPLNSWAVLKDLPVSQSKQEINKLVGSCIAPLLEAQKAPVNKPKKSGVRGIPAGIGIDQKVAEAWIQKQKEEEAAAQAAAQAAKELKMLVH